MKKDPVDLSLADDDLNTTSGDPISSSEDSS